MHVDSNRVKPVESIAVTKDEYFCADLDWLFYMKIWWNI